MSCKALKLFLPLLLFFYCVYNLDYEKSFLVQDQVSTVYDVRIYRNSFLYTADNDIVQKSLETGQVQRTFRGHTRTVQAFLIFNETMISSGWDGNFIVWDLLSGSIVKRIMLELTEAFPNSLFHAEHQIFIGGMDQKVRRVDLNSSIVMKEYDFGSAVYCIAVSGDYLFVGKHAVPHAVKVLISTGEIVLEFNGHTSKVLALLLNKNKDLVTASADAKIRIFDTVSGNAKRVLTGHEGAINALTASDDFLFSGSSDRTIRKWNMNSGVLINTFAVAHGGPIISLDASQNWLLSGSEDSSVISWNTDTAQLTKTFKGYRKGLTGVVSWNNFMISAGSDGLIKFWNIQMNALDASYSYYDHVTGVNCLLLHEGDLFSGAADGRIIQWDLSTNVVKAFFNSHTDSILSMVGRFNYLYTTGADCVVKRWTISDKEATHTSSKTLRPLTSLSFYQDRLFAGSLDSSIYGWNLTFSLYYKFNCDIREVRVISIVGNQIIAGGYGVQVVSVSSMSSAAIQTENVACNDIIYQNGILFTAHDDGLIRLRTLESLEALSDMAGHSHEVLSLTFDITGILYSAGSDGSIRKWNLRTKTVSYSFENRNGSVTALAVADNVVFAGLRTGTLDIFDKRTGLLTAQKFQHKQPITTILTYDNSVYTSSLDGLILEQYLDELDKVSEVLNISSGELTSMTIMSSSLYVIQDSSNIIAIQASQLSHLISKFASTSNILTCITATDKLIIAGAKNGLVLGWNIQTRQLKFGLSEQNGRINALAILEDNLFSASDDRTIAKWSISMKTLQFLMRRYSLTSLGHLGPVTSLSICSRVLFSGGSDLTVRRWNVDNGRHDDVYFGHSKKVNAVVCSNYSVFSASDDFAVLLYEPRRWPTLNSTTVDVDNSTIHSSSASRIIKTVRSDVSGDSAVLDNLIIIMFFTVVFVLITVFTIRWFLYSKKNKNFNELSDDYDDRNDIAMKSNLNLSTSK